MTERLYWTLPEPVIEALLEDGVIDQPNGIIESIEGSTMIPYFEPDEFKALLEEMEEVSAQALSRLQERFPDIYPAADSGQSRENGGEPGRSQSAE